MTTLEELLTILFQKDQQVVALTDALNRVQAELAQCKAELEAKPEDPPA